MCGRFSLEAPKEMIEQKFGVSLSDLNYTPRLNIAPHQGILVIIVDEKGNAQALPMVWGFIPSWVKDLERMQPPINARLETAENSRYFQYAYKNRRCLIPVTSFYEWDKTTRPKTPYKFYNPSEPLFALAGLWSPHMDTQGNEMNTSTILTTTASKDVSWLHDRMPLILNEEEWSPWLAGSLNEFSTLSENELSFEAVSPQINNPRFDPLSQH